MKFLVDANVLSETTKPAPDPKVIAWLRSHERDIAVNPVILGEIQFGILLLPKSRRRQRLENWFSQVVLRISCLPWEAATGICWAKLLARLRSAGHAMPVKDSLIAATALRHSLTLATHNTKDFEKTGVILVNPFLL
jgi:predicted nucleic acid-binding protein